VIVVCRSLTCQLMGQRALQERIETRLGVGEHGTTDDGAWSLMTEECLAACDHAPCMLINEKMHKRVRPEELERILNDPDNDKLDIPRSDLFDAPPRTAWEAGSSLHEATRSLKEVVDTLPYTSDVDEMRDAE
jgi:hypothetical protein